MADNNKTYETPVDKKEHHINPKEPPKNIFISVGSMILLAIIFVAFVFVPSTSARLGGGVLEFGSYGKERVDTSPNSYFINQAIKMEETYRQYGIDSNLIWRLAFNNAMDRAAKLDEARRAGIMVSDRQASDILRQQFLNEQGVFDRSAFARLPETAKIGAIAEIKQGFSIQYYESGLTENMLRSDEILKFVVSPTNTARNVKLAVFYGSNYPQAEVVAYAQNNAHLFTKIELERVVFDSKKNAETALASLNSGAKTFEDLGVSATSEAYFYQLKEEVTNSADAEALITQMAGEISKVVALKEGGQFALYRVVASPVLLNIANNDSMDGVKNYLLNYEKTLIADYFTSLTADFTTSNFDIETSRLGGRNVVVDGLIPLYNRGLVAEHTHIQNPFASDIEDFKANFTNERGGFADALLSNSNFFATAFKLQPNEVSSPIVLADETFAIIKMLLVNEEPLPAKSVDREVVDNYINDSYHHELAEGLVTNPRYKDNFDKAFAKIMASRTANAG